jgi:uncharacterized SAM-binding protein YcdF (DUF218 family)
MPNVRQLRTLIIAGFLFIAGLFFFETLLIGAYRVLIYEDSLVNSKAIVVLVGSANGNRVRAAAKLYHEGFGEKLVFSGFEIYPGAKSSTLMSTYAIKLGVHKNDIITEISSEEVSTQGESISNLKLLHKNQIKNFILVTSDFHTRRTKLIYDKTILSLGYDLEFLIHPAPDPFSPVDRWWKLRTGQKAVFFEYIKSIAYYFNL